MVTKNSGIGVATPPGQVLGGAQQSAPVAMGYPQGQQSAAYPPNPDIYGNVASQARLNSYPSHLSVDDIERLAKAGVHMDIGLIVPMVVHKATDDHRENEIDRLAEPWKFNNLARSVWERWIRARRALNDPDQGDPLDGSQVPFVLLGTQHGDTVYLSVHPTHQDKEPFILTDNAIIFPSDALMAKIALWEKDNT